MTVSDEQPIEGDKQTPAETPANDLNDKVDVTPEPAADSGDAKPEAKKRTLASGREATTIAGGPTLENFGGVATHRIVNEAPDKPDAKAGDGEAAEAVEGEFDPAADMPMYRRRLRLVRAARRQQQGIRRSRNAASKSPDRRHGAPRRPNHGADREDSSRSRAA